MENTLNLPEHGLTYEEMLELCRRETKRRVSETVDICAPFIDTPEGRLLMEEQLYGVLIQMFTYMQANLRKTRKDRQREGIEAARAKGVRFGRRPKYNAADYADIFKKVQNGEIDRETAREEIAVCSTTYFRMQKELREMGVLQ